MSQIFSTIRMFAVKHVLPGACLAMVLIAGCGPPAVDRTCNPLDPWSCGGAGAFCGQTPAGGRCVPWSCGDGSQDAPEECDPGADLDAISCASYLGGTGSFSCGADCRWDFSGCSRCGNRVLNGLEDCDGDRFLPPHTTESLGYPGGVLECLPSCRIDTRGCLF
jgi:hypothetical protein